MMRRVFLVLALLVAVTAAVAPAVAQVAEDDLRDAQLSLVFDHA